MHRRQFLKGSAFTLAAVALFGHKAAEVPLPTDRPVLVSAYDSSVEARRVADIRCSGFDDAPQIQRAIDAGHSIRMTGGTFDFTRGGIHLKGPGSHYIVGNRFVTTLL
jgi:hypothetical protein